MIRIMVNKEITHQKRKRPFRSAGTMERIFLQKKLNHWTGGVLFAGLAVAMGFLVARDMRLGIGVLGAIL